MNVLSETQLPYFQLFDAHLDSLEQVDLGFQRVYHDATVAFVGVADVGGDVFVNVQVDSEGGACPILSVPNRSGAVL
jgi:hypothetical protein